MAGIERPQNVKSVDTLFSRLKNIPQVVDDAYFHAKRFESSEFYRRLGIQKIKKYHPVDGQEAQKRKTPEERTKLSSFRSEQGIETHIKSTKLGEVSHIVAFGATSVYAGIELAPIDLKLAIAVEGLNALINAYGVIWQRYDRVRLYDALKRLQQRKVS